jgi:hypothetical protein
VAAAQALFDRGWGTAMQSIESADVTPEPLQIIVRHVDNAPSVRKDAV